jgi:hypothetical protein
MGKGAKFEKKFPFFEKKFQKYLRPTFQSVKWKERIEGSGTENKE